MLLHAENNLFWKMSIWSTMILYVFVVLATHTTLVAAATCADYQQGFGILKCGMNHVNVDESGSLELLCSKDCWDNNLVKPSADGSGKTTIDTDLWNCLMMEGGDASSIDPDTIVYDQAAFETAYSHLCLGAIQQQCGAELGTAWQMFGPLEAACGTDHIEHPTTEWPTTVCTEQCLPVLQEHFIKLQAATTCLHRAIEQHPGLAHPVETILLAENTNRSPALYIAAVRQSHIRNYAHTCNARSLVLPPLAIEVDEAMIQGPPPPTPTPPPPPTPVVTTDPPRDGEAGIIIITGDVNGVDSMLDRRNAYRTGLLAMLLWLMTSVMMCFVM